MLFNEKTAWRLNRVFFLIFKGFDDIKHTDFFTRSFTGLRGHELKLFKPQVCLRNQEIFFFTIRVIDAWKSLPAWLINCYCGTIELFKNRIDCFFKIGDLYKLLELLSSVFVSSILTEMWPHTGSKPQIRYAPPAYLMF